MPAPSSDCHPKTAPRAYPRAVEQRTLGRSGLPVSRLGLGLAALGRPGYVNLGHGADLAGRTAAADLERRTHAVLDTARGSGIVYFDVARSYGRAEEFLASWLAAREIGPAELTIGTKWGYTYTASWKRERRGCTRSRTTRLATLRRQWAETRAILGDHVDLLQVHSATLDSGILDDASVHEELARMRATERLSAIGLSLSGAGPGGDAAEGDGDRPGRSAPVRRRAGHLERAGTLDRPHPGRGERGGHGRSSSRRRWPTGGWCEVPRREPVAAQARRLGTTPDAVALAHVLEQPWATSSCRAPSASSSSATTWPPPTSASTTRRAQALRGLAMPAERYWRQRATLAWT